MLNDEMVKLIEEFKAVHKHEWHTAVVDELMRLYAVVKAGLHSNGDMQRYHLLGRFVVGQVKAAASMAVLLENAPRMGTAEDKPEGSRYIQMSDTLAGELVTGIRIGRIEGESNGRPEVQHVG